MGIFDIVGPIMVGPSSSHTAGAVRIGYVAGKLLGDELEKAEILLYGSFLATGDGHGTKQALVAGLLGMQPDDERIPYSFEEAKKRGVEISFGEAFLSEAHPNTAVLKLSGKNGKKLEVVGESVGGSQINIAQIDGIQTNFSAEKPTLIVQNVDQPGHVSEVSSMLAHKSVNIATMKLFRSAKNANAVMVVECDQDVPEDGIRWLQNIEGVIKVTYFKGI